MQMPARSLVGPRRRVEFRGLDARGARAGCWALFTLRVSADRGNLTKTVLRYTVSQQSRKDRACGKRSHGFVD